MLNNPDTLNRMRMLVGDGLVEADIVHVEMLESLQQSRSAETQKVVAEFAQHVSDPQILAKVILLISLLQPLGDEFVRKLAIHASPVSEKEFDVLVQCPQEAMASLVIKLVMSDRVDTVLAAFRHSGERAAQEIKNE